VSFFLVFMFSLVNPVNIMRPTSLFYF
jgi:hypothetical protein